MSAGTYVRLEGNWLAAQNQLGGSSHLMNAAAVTASFAVADWVNPGSMRSACACPDSKGLMLAGAASLEVSMEANGVLTMRVCYPA